MLAATLAALAFVHGASIYSMSADGSGVHRLTTGSEPAYSPSGDMLAFTRSPNEDRSEIWVSAPDGSGARRLVGAGRGYDGVSSPAWSPDGSTIAFAHFTLSEKRGLVTSIEVVDRDGRGRRAVAGVDPRALEAAYAPAWTRDGRLVYTRTRANNDGNYGFELRSVAADGTGDALFLRDAAYAAFSPDGTRVAFSDSSTKNGQTCGSDECYPNGELAVANADGSGRRILFKSESDESTPTWSPDGARIAFTSGRNVPKQEYGGAEVYTIAPDGSCLTWLTNGDRDSGLPAWAPGAGASAAGCVTDRPALQERRAPKRGRWWLGRSFGAAMLSSVDAEGIGYGDCSAFDPHDCPPPFSIYEQDMCHGGPAQRGFVQSLGKLQRVRGGALAALRDRGDTSVSLVVLTGRTAITIDVDVTIAPKTRRALYDRIVAGLRRAGHARPSKLPRPRVDKTLRRFLNTPIAVC